MERRLRSWLGVCSRLLSLRILCVPRFVSNDHSITGYIIYCTYRSWRAVVRYYSKTILLLPGTYGVVSLIVEARHTEFNY